MLQKIVYNDRPTSINNKNDAIKAIYQKGLKKSCFRTKCIYYEWGFGCRNTMETALTS